LEAFVAHGKSKEEGKDDETISLVRVIWQRIWSLCKYYRKIKDTFGIRVVTWETHLEEKIWWTEIAWLSCKNATGDASSALLKQGPRMAIMRMSKVFLWNMHQSLQSSWVSNAASICG
jgi:hypothetical protein